MCCGGKIFSCLRVEVGSLIFGVFCVVFWSFSILGSMIILVVVNVLNHFMTEYQVGRWSALVVGQLNVGLYNAIAGSLVAVGLLNFFFSVLLCVGIIKKNTAHIKAYFIFGIMTTVLATPGAIALGIVSIWYIGLMLGIPIGIYCFILHMIHLTIQQFSGGQVTYGFSHKRLVKKQAIAMV